jgi:quinol monooxygenase YgiN
MAGFGLFITHRTSPGQREAVRAIWERHMQPAIAGNPGHVAYFYCFAGDDADVIRVFQRYVDRDASEAFLRHPSYLAYLAEVEGLLAGPPEVVEAKVMWSKGVNATESAGQTRSDQAAGMG